MCCRGPQTSPNSGGFHRSSASQQLLSRVAQGCVALGLLALGCSDPVVRKRDFVHPPTYASLNAPQQRQVERVRASADQDPTNYEHQKQAGLVLMDYALAGVLPLQSPAEAYLERAFALRQDDEELLRTLGRFYNMRAVEHDFSKAQQQQQVYAALLGDEDPSSMSVSHFVAYSFYLLATIIQAADEGHSLAALRKIRDLEQVLKQRVDAQPDNIELQALAGNFALFFAGYVPIGRTRRIQTGIERFEIVKAHWDELRIGARDPYRCPNTYENFVFELAEAHLALNHQTRAREIYEELATPEPPITRGKELIAAVSQHRRDNLDAYANEKRLMPPWPSDVGNCIVCHAYTGQLPSNTLWVAPKLSFDLASTPTTADHRKVRPRAEAPDDRPNLISTACNPCHQPGGRAAHLLDLTDADAVTMARDAILDSIRTGDMPPDRNLDPEERERLIERVVSGVP